MKKIRQLFLLFVLLFLILPCILICIFQKNWKILILGTERIEQYLPAMMYENIGNEMHIETLKAQAVIMRSNLIKKLDEGKTTYQELQAEYSLADRRFKEEDQNYYDRLVRACKETEGEVVFYEEELCYCPYFYASSGVTRDAFSFFGDDRYPYVVAVPSHRDEESKFYITYHYFSIEEFTNAINELCEDTFTGTIQILETDESGYIIWVQAGETVIGGEVLRKALHLSSGCFSIEQVEESVRICCKGRGHGFGFSQYGANAMAVDGKAYKELLDYYFHNITIKNVYTFT